MSRARSVSWCAAGLLSAALAAPAFAKSPAQAPTLEDLRVRAQQAEAEAHRKEADAQRDFRKDAIDAYRTKKCDLKDYQKLVDILLDAKTPEVQEYRSGAAEALVKRFDLEEAEKYADVRQVRREIALQLIDLLGAPAKDDKGLLAGETIFYAWYRTQVVQNHWNRAAKVPDRQKAARKIRDFLKKSVDN